jgi:aspartyl-tRNA(Asn)/glutamyl-tRNA(Gln) amidotransferase subunit B
LQKIVAEALAENPDAVANYKKGKANAVMFLVGQVMKKARGKSDPQTAKTMVEQALQAK